MVNEKDIFKFYKFLDHKSETEIRMINPQTKVAISFFVHSGKEFLEVCKKHNGQYNIYAGINERRLGGKEDLDVIAVTNIGHDVDCHGDTSKLPLAKEIINEYVEVSKNTGLNEPLMFCSGRGYWILHHVAPIEPTEENKAKIKLWASSIKRMFEKPGVEFDSTVYNFSRIARVPGTLNISDPNNHVLSYIINDPVKELDKTFSEKILEIKLPEYKDILASDIPKGSCAFMDYCLNHKLPVGEIHHIIARNFGVYVHNRPDRKVMVDAFNERLGGANLNCWLESIDKNPDRKYPFSCGQLIKFQHKHNIPLQCLECPLYKKQNEDAEPRGWACSINIKKFAIKHNFTKCHICNNDFEFNEKMGWYSCKTCNYQGGLKKFAELIIKKQEKPQ